MDLLRKNQRKVPGLYHDVLEERRAMEDDVPSKCLSGRQVLYRCWHIFDIDPELGVGATILDLYAFEWPKVESPELLHQATYSAEILLHLELCRA